MDLNQAFGNVAYACNECLLSKERRIAVEEALQVVVTELNSFGALKKQMKAIPAEKPDEKKAKTEDGIKKAAVAHHKRD